MQEENDLVIPGSNTVWGALKQDPDGCSEEQKDAVKFFVKVALVALEGKLKKASYRGRASLVTLFPKKKWYHMIAQALIFLSHMSTLDNIKANKMQESSDNSTDCDEGNERKTKRRRLVLKDDCKERETAYLKLAQECQAFRMNKENKKILAKWDIVVGLGQGDQSVNNGPDSRPRTIPPRPDIESDQNNNIYAFLAEQHQNLEESEDEGDDQIQRDMV